MTGSSTATLEEVVARAAREHWEAHQSALQLTALGSQIRMKTPELMPPKGTLLKTISAFPSVRVVPHPTNALVFGVIPADVTQTGDLFSPSFQSALRRPRLDSRFWSAFHGPISGIRYVSLNGSSGTFEVTDSRPESHPDIQVFEITNDDLNVPSYLDRIEAAWAAINKWVEKHQINILSFKERREHPQTPYSQRSFPGSPHDNLKEFFSRLSIEDMARISVPLDLVAKGLK